MIPVHIKASSIPFLDLTVAISVYFSSCPYPLINEYAAYSRPGPIRAPEALFSLSH